MARKSNRKIVAKTMESTVLKQAMADVGESRQLVDTDPFGELMKGKLVVEPPFDLFVLSTMLEINSELGPCIDSMEKNVDGFGHRIICNVNPEAEGVPDELKRKVNEEHTRLMNFFLYAGLEDSLRQLRMKTRHDIEATGNGYWEVVRGADGKIQYFVHVKSYQVRITAQEVDPFEFDMPIFEYQLDGSLKIINIKRRKRFRKYAQVASMVARTTSASGFRTIWFKEFGDPRNYYSKTGMEIPAERLEETPINERANELIHFKIYSSRSPYGMPRYIGVLMDMFGDRKSVEINYTTFCNNTVPSLIISVSNGELTQDTVDRITEFLEKLQGDDNRSKVLVLEAEPIGEEGEQTGQVKIEVKPLTSEQIHDALFQNYSKSNQEKVRVAYRLPPIILGRSSDYTRATADTSRRLADEQVFAPERDTFDDWVNRILFPEMGVLYHSFKTNSPNTTDNTELVQILSSAEKTGGMTPRRADIVLRDILGRELPGFAKDEKFNLDLPFSLSMAEAVKNMGAPNEPGQQVTALKDLNAVGALTGGAGADVVNALMVLRNQLEDEWKKMST